MDRYSQQGQRTITTYFSSSAESSRYADLVDSDTSSESIVTSTSTLEEETATIHEKLPPRSRPKAKRVCHSALVRYRKHRVSGFDRSWCKKYTWLEAVRNEGGKVQGMICRLCRDYGKPPRNGSGVWSKACTSFRKR